MKKFDIGVNVCLAICSNSDNLNSYILQVDRKEPHRNEHTTLTLNAALKDAKTQRSGH